MTTIATILLTLFIGTLLFAVFRWVGTPYYRIDVDKMVKTLEMVLTGQATENDWQLTFGMTIRHDPKLEELRQRCLEIEENHYIGQQKPPFLFTSEGLDDLKKVLEELRLHNASTE